MPSSVRQPSNRRRSRSAAAAAAAAVPWLPTLIGLASAVLASADLFDELDGNHDGTLDRAEFGRGADLFAAFLRQPNQGALGAAGAAASSWLSNLQLTSLKGFWKALTSSVAVILATEVGDKTFFIAAVLSMKHERLPVFAGAILALVIMTLLSTAMGLILPQLLDRKYTHILSGILFLYFGCKLLYESTQMEKDKHSDELEEVEEELLQQSSKKDDAPPDVEDPPSSSNSHNTTSNSGHKRRNYRAPPASNYQVLLQALTLTFLAEWGDRSQLATIALAAAKNPLGVMLGGCVGHCLCTGLAVVGGRILASRISEKMVSQWGGVIFLLFGVHSLFFEE